MSTEEREISGEETGNPAAGEKPDSGPVGDLKRRVTAGAVALVTSASVLVGGIFHSPALLPDDQELAPQVAWTENDDDDLDGSGDDGDSGSGEKSAEIAQTVEETEAPPEVWDDHRRKWQRLPVAMRLLAMLLLGVASALLTLLTFLRLSNSVSVTLLTQRSVTQTRLQLSRRLLLLP